MRRPVTRPGAPNPYPPDWKARRAFVLARDHRVCHWCGGHANTADHVTPIADGGGHELTNLVAACTPCNSARSLERNRAVQAERRAAAWGQVAGTVAARARSRRRHPSGWNTHGLLHDPSRWENGPTGALAATDPTTGPDHPTPEGNPAHDE